MFFSSYYGTGVKLGDCGISILKASINHTGMWSCHMGTTGVAGAEASKDINVRISGMERSFDKGILIYFNET